MTALHGSEAPALAVQRIQLHQRAGNPLAILEVAEAVKRSGPAAGNLKSHRPVVFASALKKLVRLAMVRLRRWSMTRLRAIVNSQVSTAPCR